MTSDEHMWNEHMSKSRKAITEAGRRWREQTIEALKAAERHGILPPRENLDEWQNSILMEELLKITSLDGITLYAAWLRAQERFLREQPSTLQPVRQTNRPGPKPKKEYVDGAKRVVSGESRKTVIDELLNIWKDEEQKKGNTVDASTLDTERKRFESGIDYQRKLLKDQKSRN
jgi:hypothetical protein